jgi:glycerate 2-kinase
LRALYDTAVQRALPAHITAAHLPPPPKGPRRCSVPARPAARWPRRWMRYGRTGAPLSGLVITRYHHVPPASRAQPGRIEVVEASHPVPEEAGRRAAERIVVMTRGLTGDDLVLALVSGGG